MVELLFGPPEMRDMKRFAANCKEETPLEAINQ
jgi:hypothetical protein